jgi:signal transduction histidine kinase/CheY-like chemotaxis protein
LDIIGGLTWLRPLTGPRGYLAMLAILAVGMLLHYAGLRVLDRTLESTFFIYTMAILVGAWHGYGPGLLATGLVLGVLPFVFQPAFSVSQINVVGLAVFSLVSVVMSRMSSARAQAERKLRDLNADLAVRVRRQTADLDTANRELEDLLARERRARADADAANRVKDDFLATLSHELRTPLTAILGWAQILQATRLTPADTAAALTAIERGAQAQARLVDEVLDLSRITSGKLAIELKRTAPADVIRAAVESLSPIATARGVRIEETLHPGAGTIVADPGRMQQIVWNLLSNAVKFTPAGGSVRVALTRRQDSAEIVVRDTGIGIEAAFLPHVFERFRQADGSFSRSHGGLGIGLAIVRHLVELHGGTVGVDSAGSGQGATFTVRLPVDGPPNAPPVADAAAAGGDAAPALDGIAVLVVEDEPDTRDMIAALLRQRGAEVATAASAPDALAMLTRMRPDVILSDIGMPGQDGFEMLRQVRALERARGAPPTPSIALTAYARPSDRARAAEAGYQVHLAKPVRPDLLLRLVKNLHEGTAPGAGALTPSDTAPTRSESS